MHGWIRVLSSPPFGKSGNLFIKHAAFWSSHTDTRTHMHTHASFLSLSLSLSLSRSLSLPVFVCVTMSIRISFFSSISPKHLWDRLCVLQFSFLFCPFFVSFFSLLLESPVMIRCLLLSIEASRYSTMVMAQAVKRWEGRRQKGKENLAALFLYH